MPNTLTNMDDDDVNDFDGSGFNESRPMKIFDKIAYNVLKKYSCKPSEAWTLRNLSGRTHPLQGHKWRNYIRNLIKHEEEKHKDDKFHFVVLHELITKDVMDIILRMIEEECPQVLEDWTISNNTTVLGDLLDLNADEKIVLDVSLAVSELDHDDVYYSLSSLMESSDPLNSYTYMTNIPLSKIKEIKKGFLFKSGFLVEHSGIKGLHKISDDMAPVMLRPQLTVDDIEEHFFPSNISHTVDLSAYPHLVKDIDRTERIINSALTTSGQKGINLMFWGVVGTGKTQLAIGMAKRNDWDLKMIGDISEFDNAEKSRAQRLTSLRIGLKLYRNRKNVVLLFDEMEDIFKDASDESYSKAFINRIIENTTIPIIWTTNNVRDMDAAVLRRMVYNIEFKVPPADARRVMWDIYREKYNLDIDSSTVTKLAEIYDIVPALINNAAKITSISGLEPDEIPVIIQQLDTLLNGGHKRRFQSEYVESRYYDLEAPNTNLNLVNLTNSVLDANPRWSLLLYGHPGTGKSNYVRYLCERMGKRILYKRASDLFGPYLGETEQNIARAFEQSASEERVLLIDEGDSFLKSRESVDRSWEVPIINEMLSQMERHPQPFCLTTNLMKNLDTAAMRRFTFKVAFDFLKPTMAAKLFETYFGMQPPMAIFANTMLAPGDYAVVKDKVDILKITDPFEIYDMLDEETKVKPENRKSIGFGAKVY